MTARYTVNGAGLSQKQAVMLCSMVKTPIPLDGISGHDRNALTALAEHELIGMDDAEATITAKGRAAVVALNKKINGEAPAAEIEKNNPKGGRRQPAEKPRKPRRDSRERPAPVEDSPPPTGVVDFDAIRAQIVEHYEADLAACDRMREIASRIRTA